MLKPHRARRITLSCWPFKINPRLRCRIFRGGNNCIPSLLERASQADLAGDGAAIKALKRNACLYLEGSLLAALDPYVEYPQLAKDAKEEVAEGRLPHMIFDPLLELFQTRIALVPVIILGISCLQEFLEVLQGFRCQRLALGGRSRIVQGCRFSRALSGCHADC